MLAKSDSEHVSQVLTRSTSGCHVKSQFAVQTLPPILLNCSFPATYPEVHPPTFSLSSFWLSKESLSALAKHLDLMWMDLREPILFAWIEWLRTEGLQSLGKKTYT